MEEEKVAEQFQIIMKLWQNQGMSITKFPILLYRIDIHVIIKVTGRAKVISAAGRRLIRTTVL